VWIPHRWTRESIHARARESVEPTRKAPECAIKLRGTRAGEGRRAQRVIHGYKQQSQGAFCTKHACSYVCRTSEISLRQYRCHVRFLASLRPPRLPGSLSHPSHRPSCFERSRAATCSRPFRPLARCSVTSVRSREIVRPVASSPETNFSASWRPPMNRNKIRTPRILSPRRNRLDRRPGES